AETETQAQRRHKRGGKLLAQRPGNERIRRGLGPDRSPGHIDLYRTSLRSRHVETFSGAETFCLAYRVSRGDAVRGAIRCELAFLMAADGACRRYSHDGVRSIFGAFDRRFCGIAG